MVAFFKVEVGWLGFTQIGAAFPQACAGWGGFLVKRRQLKIAGAAAQSGKEPESPAPRTRPGEKPGKTAKN